MKIEFFKKKNNFKKKPLALNPSLYWEITTLIVFLMIISFSFFGYNLFKKINQESVLPTIKDSGQVGKVNKDRILNVLNYFSKREEKSNQILNSPSPVVDPSL